VIAPSQRVTRRCAFHGTVQVTGSSVGFISLKTARPHKNSLPHKAPCSTAKTRNTENQPPAVRKTVNRNGFGFFSTVSRKSSASCYVSGTDTRELTRYVRGRAPKGDTNQSPFSETTSPQKQQKEKTKPGFTKPYGEKLRGALEWDSGDLICCPALPLARRCLQHPSHPSTTHLSPLGHEQSHAPLLRKDPQGLPTKGLVLL